jgi:hypothetical protein
LGFSVVIPWPFKIPESTPKIVNVFPVPGGPYNKVNPRSVLQTFLIALYYDGLKNFLIDSKNSSGTVIGQGFCFYCGCNYCHFGALRVP